MSRSSGKSPTGEGHGLLAHDQRLIETRARFEGARQAVECFEYLRVRDAEHAPPDGETLLERGDPVFGLAGAHLCQPERFERVGDTRVALRKQPAAGRQGSICDRDRLLIATEIVQRQREPSAEGGIFETALAVELTLELASLELLGERLLEAAELDAAQSRR